MMHTAPIGLDEAPSEDAPAAPRKRRDGVDLLAAILLWLGTIAFVAGFARVAVSLGTAGAVIYFVGYVLPLDDGTSRGSLPEPPRR